MNKSTLSRIMAVIKATIYGFIHDQCYFKASALTYYTLLAIVPMLAVAFGFAKGFGFEQHLRSIVTETFKEQPEISDRVIQFAYSLLAHAEGGLIAGVGVVFLLWTAVGLMSSIEDALNEIGKVSRPRSLYRRFSDYLAAMLLAPFFLVIASSTTILAGTFFHKISQENEILSPFLRFTLHLFPYLSITTVIACIYIFLPNTRLKFRYAIIAALIAAAAYQLVQWIYIQFQIGVSSYGAIYGSFAALPLFFLWVHTSWLIVLAGAELAFHAEYEGGDHLNQFSNFEIEPTEQKIVYLRVVTLFIKALNERRGFLTCRDVSTRIGIPYSLAQKLVIELVRAGILVEIYTDKSDPAFHPAHDIYHLTLNDIFSSLRALREDVLIELPCTQEIKQLKEAVVEWEKQCRLASDNLALSTLV